MKKLKIIIPTLMLLGFNSSKGQNNFYLKDIHYLSDINYKAIAKIDEYSLEKLEDSVFNVLNGNYTIYRFVKASTLESKDNLNSKENKELIIAKVFKNKIVEAYYCPLNWREPPISSVLLFSKTKVRLSKKVCTKAIKFKNITPNGVRVLKDGHLVLVNK